MSVNTPFSGGRSRDQSLSYQDFMNLRKQQLKQRCVIYGLKSHGTKEALATCLVFHFHRGNRCSEVENPVPGPSQPHLSEDDDDSASNIVSGNPTANVQIDEMRVLIREEISQAILNKGGGIQHHKAQPSHMRYCQLPASEMMLSLVQIWSGRPCQLRPRTHPTSSIL